MTFIASVISKRGVALIADSLVTTKRPVIEWDDFREYIKKKSDNEKAEINIEPEEIRDLFKYKASHTKDYEEKLFKYDKYTAISTAGSASINNKKIIELVTEARQELGITDEGYEDINFEERVNQFKDFIEKNVKSHIQENESISPTVFIITNYDLKLRKTKIYKLEVNIASVEDLKNDKFDFLTLTLQPDHFKVVCDGQNRISERILFGDIDSIINLIFRIAMKISKDFDISEDKIDHDYIYSLLENKEIVTQQALDDIKINKLTELSLQQAVDLACLLMKIEIDIQKYTENIPTVGGVIKLAVIDDEGFRFIKGNEIVMPETF